jgi:hypothetical protein
MIQSIPDFWGLESKYPLVDCLCKDWSTFGTHGTKPFQRVPCYLTPGRREYCITQACRKKQDSLINDSRINWLYLGYFCELWTRRSSFLIEVPYVGAWEGSEVATVAYTSVPGIEGSDPNRSYAGWRMWMYYPIEKKTVSLLSGIKFKILQTTHYRPTLHCGLWFLHRPMRLCYTIESVCVLDFYVAR